MASISLSPKDEGLSLLLSSFKDLNISQTPAEKSSLKTSTGETIDDSNAIALHLNTLIPVFSQTSYSGGEKAELKTWLDETSSSPVSADTLTKLNDHLKTRTTLLGTKLSVADVIVYTRVRSAVKKWSDEDRTGEKGYRHIVRWVDFIQNTPELALNVAEADKVPIDVNKVLFYPKPEEPPKKEKKEGGAGAAVEKVKEGAKDAKDAVKKAAGAAVGEGKKKEKKEKPKKEPPPPKAEPTISPSQVDLRVGHILYCRPHPNADSLFVSTIAMGDDASSPYITDPSTITDLPEHVTSAHNPLPPVRTVCSGLNGLVPIEEMQNRKVIVVANLKPVTMRGIKSAAMVLAASPPPAEGADPHKKEVVELCSPPEGAATGEKVFFEGYEGTPEAQLNPKKKIFEAIQPGFRTAESDGTVEFARTKAGWGAEDKKWVAGPESGRLVTKSGGVCKAPTLRGANCS